MEYLYSDGKSINVGMTYWSEAIEPDGQGEWQLRIGYITSVKQGGRYIRPWEGTLCMDDIVASLNLSYRNKKEHGYDMTLMWYSERFPQAPTPEPTPSVQLVVAGPSTRPTSYASSIAPSMSTLPSMDTLLGIPHARESPAVRSHKRALSLQPAQPELMKEERRQ